MTAMELSSMGKGGEADDTAAFTIPSLATDGTTERIATKYGPICVTVVGDRAKHPCITFHDIGLNHATCFQALLVAADSNSLLVNNFCFYHIDAPGSEAGAEGVPVNVLPMTSHKLVDQIKAVVDHYKLKEFIGLGAGFGGYLLTEYAALHPKDGMVGMILISPPAKKVGWTEWSYGKVTLGAMRIHGMSNMVVDSLVARLFSPSHRNWMGGGGSDLVKSFKRDISEMHPAGVSALLRACLERDDLIPLLPKVKCHALIVMGDCSMYAYDTMDMNAAVKDHELVRFVQVDHCGGLCSEEKPQDLASATQLFLQALKSFGYGRHDWDLTMPGAE